MGYFPNDVMIDISSEQRTPTNTDFQSDIHGGHGLSPMLGQTEIDSPGVDSRREDAPSNTVDDGSPDQSLYRNAEPEKQYGNGDNHDAYQHNHYADIPIGHHARKKAYDYGSQRVGSKEHSLVRNAQMFAPIGNKRQDGAVSRVGKEGNDSRRQGTPFDDFVFLYL